MSDINDISTQDIAAREEAHAELRTRLEAASALLSALLKEPLRADVQGQSLTVTNDAGASFSLRKGSLSAVEGYTQKTVENALLDDRLAAELDAIFRLVEQLEAIDIRQNRTDTAADDTRERRQV